MLLVLSKEVLPCWLLSHLITLQLLVSPRQQDVSFILLQSLSEILDFHYEFQSYCGEKHHCQCFDQLSCNFKKMKLRRVFCTVTFNLTKFHLGAIWRCVCLTTGMLQRWTWSMPMWKAHECEDLCFFIAATWWHLVTWSWSSSRKCMALSHKLMKEWNTIFKIIMLYF